MSRGGGVWEGSSYIGTDISGIWLKVHIYEPVSQF